MRGAYRFLEVIYHSTVREIRKSDGNAFVGLLKEILQSLILVGIFYVMISLMNLRGTAIRGNFVVYILSGIFMYMTHVKAVGKVAGSGGPTGSMMKHAPMSTLAAIVSSAISALYLQILAACVILFVTHTLLEPVDIHSWKGTVGCFFLAWASGVSVGLVFLALTPFLPNLMPIVTQIYQRANMIFSGKMFVANSLPAHVLPFFSWNPLFHTIDQARGFAFLNYYPHNSNLNYPIYFTLVMIVLGMMLEHWARKYASESWSRR